MTQNEEAQDADYLCQVHIARQCENSDSGSALICPFSLLDTCPPRFDTTIKQIRLNDLVLRGLWILFSLLKPP